MYQFDYSPEHTFFQNGRQNAINVLSAIFLSLLSAINVISTIFLGNLSDNGHFFVTKLD